MGWLYHCNPNMDRKRTVETILGDYRHDHGRFARLVDHSLNGNTLYMVLQNPVRRPSFVRPAPKITVWPTEFHLHGNYRFIAVYLLKGPARDSGEGWGYKDMDESMGPVEAGCPERLLKQSQVEDKHGWRERCREKRRKDAARRKWAKTLKPGDRLKVGSFEKAVTYVRAFSNTYFVGRFEGESTVYKFRLGWLELPEEMTA